MSMWRRDASDLPVITPIPSRRDRPPKAWATIEVAGGDVVVRLSGWRRVWAVTSKLVIPAGNVVDVAHDPEARAHVRAKLRRSAARTGVMRLGAYHSLQGWSFWAIGLGRNAVVITTSGVRFRHVVVEVEDPAATVREVEEAAAAARRAILRAVDGEAAGMAEQSSPPVDEGA